MRDFNFTSIIPDSKYLVVIAGPTAVGKTRIGIELARHYRSVILSADSRQFYKELTIGTAKPGAEELNAVRHYFINSRSISDLYGAGHFEKDALELLTELYKTHEIVFLVGGSGLYIDALLHGVDDFIDVPNEIREKLNRQFLTHGIEWLRSELKNTDPEYYTTVDTRNPQRMIRALEVSTHTGKPFSSFLLKNRSRRHFIPVKILVDTEREALYAQINRRVDQMMEAGLINEVTQLVNAKHLNALKTVGYKELYDYLEGKYDLETAVEKIKQHTRNYAKRQLTWFKNKDDFKSFKPGELNQMIRYIDKKINND